MFDLKAELKIWRKTLMKEQGLEPGYIEELESNLLDRFDDLIAKGKTGKEAFNMAKKKSFTDTTEVADEFYKSRSPIIDKTPPWRKNQRIFNLLPSFLKVALRSFNRTKAYTLINYLGLTIGLLVTCFVGFYINYEVSWDTFHSKSDSIYRLGNNMRSQEYSLVSFDGWNSSTKESQLAQVEGFKNTVGVKDITQFWVFTEQEYVQVENQQFIAEEILRTNTPESFFNIFDWNFIMGSPSDVSESINKALLTEKTATQFFGNSWNNLDLLSKTIIIDSTQFQIAGVIENIPSNSHFDFSIVLNQETIPYWGARTYALLEESADANEVKDRWIENLATIKPDLITNPTFDGFTIRPLEELHLEANALYEAKQPGNKKYLYIFGIIGLMIISITLTNYTNLSTAMYSGRNREIGMRKVMGATKAQIAGQFILEAALLSLSTVPIVILMFSLLLPDFNSFMGVELENQFFNAPYYAFILSTVAVLIGCISGIYPAVFLSRMGIKKLFYSKLISEKSQNFSLRKGLIIFQFALLIGLCSATYLINSQLKFINEKDLGFNKEGIVYINLEVQDDYELLKNKLSLIPGVQSVGTGTPLGTPTYNQLEYRLEGVEEIFDDAYMPYMNPDAIKTLGIKTTVDEELINPETASKTLFLINQTAAERFKTTLGVTKEELVGRTVITEPNYVNDEGVVGISYQIDGFIEDINMFSLKEKVDPYFMIVSPRLIWYSAVINFNTENTTQVLSDIREAYSSMGWSAPMITSFQDDMLEELYEQEKRVASLTIYLSILAFLMALMGLIGLTAYLTTIKRKEIGIRKILGASNSQIITMLNKEYIYLVITSLIIASPFVYLGMSKWLSEFAFRISINPIIFLLTAICTLLITLLVVSSQTFKVASEDPAYALRND
ncbi:MAG: ABC transporter permease [Balneolaceae bacterium]